MHPEEFSQSKHNCIKHAQFKKGTTGSIAEAPKPLPLTKVTSILTPHNTVLFWHRFLIFILKMRKVGFRMLQWLFYSRLSQRDPVFLIPDPVSCLLFHTASLSFNFLENKSDFCTLPVVHEHLLLKSKCNDESQNGCPNMIFYKNIPGCK